MGDTVVLCRASIIVTYLTRVFILNKDPPPQCEHCQCTLTVRHILMECDHRKPTRKDIFGNTNILECFQFHPELILNFLKKLIVFKVLIFVLL